MCFAITQITDTICFRLRNKVFPLEKQIVSMFETYMKQYLA